MRATGRAETALASRFSRAEKRHVLCRRHCGRQEQAGPEDARICVGRPETTQNFVLASVSSDSAAQTPIAGRCAMWLVCGCVYALSRLLRQGAASCLILVGGKTLVFCVWKNLSGVLRTDLLRKKLQRVKLQRQLLRKVINL